MDFLNKEFIDSGKQDPVLRCDSCQSLVKLEVLHKLGSCFKCGNKRVRNVTVFDEDERALIEEWGFHDFLGRFEGVEDA